MCSNTKASRIRVTNTGCSLTLVYVTTFLPEDPSKYRRMSSNIGHYTCFSSTTILAVSTFSSFSCGGERKKHGWRADVHIIEVELKRQTLWYVLISLSLYAPTSRYPSLLLSIPHSHFAFLSLCIPSSLHPSLHPYLPLSHFTPHS